MAQAQGLIPGELVDCDLKHIDEKDDISIEYMVDTDFTSNDHYTYLIHNAVFVLIGFLVVFLITFLMYCKQKSIYNKLVKAKAEAKRRELLQKESMYGRNSVQESHMP